MRSVCSDHNLRLLARMLVITMLLALAAAGATRAADEAVYQERVEEQKVAPPPAQSIQDDGEWLPRCSPPIVIAAVFKQDHKVHVIGYVKRSKIGKTLKLQSKLAGGTVMKFRSRRNGYFHIKTTRPLHRHAKRAAWRVTRGGLHTPWVKLYRPLVLNNVHQRKGLLMLDGSLNVPARDDTVVAVHRLDDCHSATRIGQLGLPIDGSGVLNGGIQLRDLVQPVSTFVRLRVRVRDRETGAWGKSFWSLPLPVVLRP